MAQEITVTLTNEQVQHGLASGRIVYPDMTNAELEAILTASATHGPGVYVTIGEWDAQAFNEDTNQRRKQAIADFEQVFPPPTVPEPEPEPEPAARGKQKGRK